MMFDLLIIDGKTFYMSIRSYLSLEVIFDHLKSFYLKFSSFILPEFPFWTGVSGLSGFSGI